MQKYIAVCDICGATSPASKDFNEVRDFTRLAWFTYWDDQKHDYGHYCDKCRKQQLQGE